MQVRECPNQVRDELNSAYSASGLTIPAITLLTNAFSNICEYTLLACPQTKLMYYLLTCSQTRLAHKQNFCCLCLLLPTNKTCSQIKLLLSLLAFAHKQTCYILCLLAQKQNFCFALISILFIFKYAPGVAYLAYLLIYILTACDAVIAIFLYLNTLRRQ